MDVTVSIVTYRSRACIDACLAGVRAQGAAVREVLVADNGGDDTAAYLRRRHPAVRVRELGYNAGFAAAHNANFALARGSLFLALNPDVALAAGCLARLADALAGDAALGAAQGRLLAPGLGERLDSAGIRWSAGRTRFLDRGRGEPASRYAHAEDVFGACGAAALYRTSALRAVSRPLESPFAESLFMYYEDVDLAWRLRRAGWRTRFVPEARAVHQRGGSGASAAFVEYHLVRNRLWVSLRNASAGELLRELPGLALFEGAKLVQALARPHLRRALRDQLRGVPSALASRSHPSSTHAAPVAPVAQGGR
jgi:GT2 family glycosyltransferase